MMKDLPSIDVLKSRLSGLNHAELNALSVKSDVPFGTLMKIRQGDTEDPRLSTVIKIMESLPRRAKQAAKPASPAMESAA